MVATAASTDTVEISDIGPIAKLSIPCPPGKVVVLTGPNGGGKTHALKTIDAIVNKSGERLENRDGTHKGEASFAGVTIKVGRNGANRRLGDPTVATLEDDLNLDDLVDPGLKDPAASDVRRIKALAKVCGVALPLEELHKLIGGPVQFRSIVDESKLQMDDVVGSIDKVKRDIETAARTAENAAVQHFQAAKSKLAENEGIDLEGCCDEKQLQDQFEAAFRTSNDLKSRAKQHAEQAERAHAAESALAKAVQGYTGPTAETAAANLDRLDQELAAQEQLCADLEKQLTAAANKHKLIADQRKSAQDALSAANSHEAALDGWQKTIDSSVITAPTAEEIAAADAAVQSARDATSAGVRIRDGLKRASEAKALEDKAAESRKVAERLRDAAQATLDVLATAVSKISNQLTVDSDFRLIVQHPKRQTTYFAELSAGERWRLAIDIAIEACRRKGERCVFVTRQESWEGLDGRNRKAIVEHIAETEATMYTAEASKETDASGDVAFEVLGAKA